ncbi:MAG: RNA polymerase factor sigma-54 [Lautropia sp.]|nr:RNA polymerase factor sigma-54 [Lautropia sp.]
MGQSISLQLNRSLSIAPALQRSLQLLQMNALEFEQEISQALDNNPLLELEESAEAVADAADIRDAMHPDAADLPLEADSGEYLDASLADSFDEMSRDDLTTYDDIDSGVLADAGSVMDSDTAPEITAELNEAAGDEFNEHLSDWSTTSKSGQGEGLSALDMAPAQGSLRDHLLQQLGSLRLGPQEQHLCILIIDSLDPAGYLREDLEELAEISKQYVEGSGRGKPAITVDDVRIALRRVQSFDPPGIAARTIDECLTLQLQAVPEASAGRSIAIEIVRNHLQLLAHNDFRGITAATGASEADLSAATRLIRSMDPKPGLGFGKDRVVFAVPEVIVKKVKGVWAAALHPAATPRIRLNAQYASIVSRNEGGQCNGLTAQLQEAKWLMRSIEQRANTIEKTAAAIVARQQAFFEHGDIGLQPLKLADIAADVGIHESTVSRVVNSKYLQCPAGLIPMRKFFTSHVETSAGDACSATAVKAMIRQLVDSEAAGEPLSDHRLAKMLAQRGIRIARRTVTKYRDALGIEAADLRRQLNQPAAGADLARKAAKVPATARRRAAPAAQSVHA